VSYLIEDLKRKSNSLSRGAARARAFPREVLPWDRTIPGLSGLCRVRCLLAQTLNPCRINTKISTSTRNWMGAASG